MNRIEKKFKELKKNNQKAFVVFITAGYPNLSVTEKLILQFASQGVDIIELGVPFSDPLADGPIIQESSQAALKKGINLNEIFNLVKGLRRYTQIPIALMSYYNPIFCFGEERFVKKAKVAGCDGVIIPDLPPEEASLLIKFAQRSDLDTIFFLSPTSTLERIKIVSRFSQGFIYYVSLTGVTGPRLDLPVDLVKNLKAIKGLTPKPVCVGFGVSHPEQVKKICHIADGVIIGSAIIREIRRNLGRRDLLKKVTRFVGWLATGRSS